QSISPMCGSGGLLPGGAGLSQADLFGGLQLPRDDFLLATNLDLSREHNLDRIPDSIPSEGSQSYNDMTGAMDRNTYSSLDGFIAGLGYPCMPDPINVPTAPPASEGPSPGITAPSAASSPGLGDAISEFRYPYMHLADPSNVPTSPPTSEGP